MDAVPSGYFQYYYFEQELLAELTAKPTTRAEDILGWVPGYWRALRGAGRAATRRSSIPARSRGGIDELELAIDCMAAVLRATAARRCR